MARLALLCRPPTVPRSHAACPGGRSSHVRDGCQRTNMQRTYWARHCRIAISFQTRRCRRRRRPSLLECTASHSAAVGASRFKLPVRSSSGHGTSQPRPFMASGAAHDDGNVDYSHPLPQHSSNLSGCELAVARTFKLPMIVTGTGVCGQQGPSSTPPRRIGRPAGDPPHRRQRAGCFVPAHLILHK